jgi:hypothetical protein
MWTGAGLALLSTIATVAVLSRIRTSLLNAAIRNNSIARSQGKTVPTMAQIHSFVNGYVLALIAFGIISVLLWGWMAWANGRGTSWARIVATVLFGLLTIWVLLSLTRANVSVIFIVVEWLVGLGATLFLWRPDASEYFGRAKFR